MRRFSMTILLASMSVCAIAQQGATNISDLIGQLNAPDPLVRERSARELASFGPAAAVATESLVQLFRDTDPYVQGAAATALGAVGKPAVPALTAALRDTAAGVRGCAAIALGKMGEEAVEGVPALVAALTDRDEQVRWCVAAALAGLGKSAAAAVPALRHCLADRDADVRWAAALALETNSPAEWFRKREWPELIAIIDSLTPALMAELRVPGVAIALIRDGEVRWSKNFGVADVRSGSPVTDETLFEAASMSKPVFACAAMKLAEDARLDIDRPLVEYLKEANVPHQRERNLITARMILSHTSGLPNWRKGEEERDGPLPVQFAPGTRFGYSGEGMFALQRVVEHIIGEPLDRWARRTLFEPLGLKESGFAWSQEIEGHLAAGHDEKGIFLQKTKYVHPNSAYTLYTTAREYATFLAKVMQPGMLLSRASLEAMLSYQVHVDVREPIERPGAARGGDVWWGLGWSINSTAAGDIIHHSGANRSGFRSYSQYSPSRKTGLVIMTNGLGGSDLWTRLVSVIGDI